MVVAPIEPNVEITANPMGPQLHAPAIEPTIEPKILPPIFCFEFLRWVILNRFIGITNADNIERIVIRTNPNSLPGGIWVTKKGSKKINSEINSKVNIKDEKIINDSKMNLKSEKINFKIFIIYTIESKTDLNTENGWAPPICFWL